VISHFLYSASENSVSWLYCPARWFVSLMAILGGWGLDRLPFGRLFKLVAATKGSFKYPPGLELSLILTSKNWKKFFRSIRIEITKKLIIGIVTCKLAVSMIQDQIMCQCHRPKISARNSHHCRRLFESLLCLKESQ
jgi:hypothetical protein